MVTIISCTVPAGTGVTIGLAGRVDARGWYRKRRVCETVVMEGASLTLTFPPRDLGITTLAARGLRMRIFWSR